MAKIIKGGADGAPKPHAPIARAPQIFGDRKVINREAVNAKGQAQDILKDAEDRAAERKALGEQQAQDAYNEAHEAASRAVREQAVETILRAYKSRGDDLMAAWEQCLEVSSGVVTRITGAKLTIEQSAARSVVTARLRTGRSKFRAVIRLPDDDVERLKAHEPLAKALEEVPEFVLESGEGVLVVSGGEVPLDLAMANTVLCRVLEVEPLQLDEPAPEEDAAPEEAAAPEAEEEAPADDGAAPEEVAASAEEEEAPAEQHEDEPEPVDEEGTGNLEAQSDEEPATSDVPPDEEVHAEALADEGLPEGIDEQPDEPVAEEPSSMRRQPPPPPVREPSVVMQQPERSAITRTTNRAVPLPPATPRPTPPVDGTRVDIGGTNSRVMPRPIGTSSSIRVMPPPRQDFLEPDDDGASTVATPRDELGMGKRPLPGAPSPTPVGGTRVDVRHTPPSTLAKKPLR